MSKTMAEALARRNFEAEYDGLPWDELPDSAKQGWVNEAQAIIDFLSAAGFGLVTDAKAKLDRILLACDAMDAGVRIRSGDPRVSSYAASAIRAVINEDSQ